jgi:esterase/lipase superfamily enzyme
VIVHGYNIEFDEAARRTAQIGYDLRVDGITTFFSWPSRGRVVRYFQDEETVQLSERKFLEFIRHLSAVPEIDEISILAHSMGNRLLLGTVARLLHERTVGSIKAPIGQIILTAADIPSVGFHQEATSYLELAKKRVTTYSCTQDIPLRVSRFIHGGRDRIGLQPPVFVYPQVDSISAGDLDLYGLGHNYYAENAPVIYDLAQLLHHDTAPDSRLRLERGPAEHGLHWIIKR